MVRSDRRAEAAPTLRRPVAFPVWEDPPWSEQVHFADPWHSQCRRTLRGPIRFTSPTRGIPSVGGPSVVRSDRRAEAAPTLCRPVAFPVWEDPPWSDQVHFADPWHSRCGKTLRDPNRFTSPTRGIPSVTQSHRPFEHVGVFHTGNTTHLPSPTNRPHLLSNKRKGSGLSVSTCRMTSSKLQDLCLEVSPTGCPSIKRVTTGQNFFILCR